jgi:outer membrane lipoprotein SlyB
MKLQFLCMAGTLVLATLLTACTPDISAGTYNTSQIGQAAATSPGVIVAATPIKVNSNSGSTIGTVAGAVAGGVAGSAIGGTRANLLGGVGGALLGGALGNYAGQKLSTQTGMQYTVRLRGGQMYTVTQGINPILAVRQHVMVIFSNPARIVAAY